MTQTRCQTLFWQTTSSHWTIPPDMCPWETHKHNLRGEFYDICILILWPLLMLFSGLSTISDLIRKSNLFMQFFRFPVLCSAVDAFAQNRALKISPRCRRTSKQQWIIVVFLIFMWTHSCPRVVSHQTVSLRLKEHSKTLTFARHLGASAGTLPVHLQPPQTHTQRMQI